MDVCVCTTQVPFMRGGAELHIENLVAALERAGHRAEAVRLPAAWDRDRVFDAALAWRMVPVDADLVIATNFPSYFVRHPNKVVWLFHQHRIAYDAADQPWSDIGLDDTSLEAQRQLVAWDDVALAEATRLFATSHTVADRVARYNGLRPEPLYHPPPLADRLHAGPYGDEVLCITRLEANKRPDLFVEAFGHASPSARGGLLGKGSMRDALAARAAELSSGSGGGAVEVAGFVDDAALVERLSRARAVVYAPFDEDYGYVTLQAFLAAKPVITTPDAGGVLEFVEHEHTGLVSDGTPQGLAAAIDRLAGDEDLARRLGENGLAKVRALDWGGVVEALVGQ